MSSKRSFLICGNWKLHHCLQETQEVLRQIVQGLNENPHVKAAIAPVAPLLYPAGEILRSTSLALAAQNVFHEAKGAFTGEWSVKHLKELGCQYAIVGHSERRQYFGDTDKTVALKVKACLTGGITPIACVGESLQERELGLAQTVIHTQIKAIIEGLDKNQIPQLVIAYEPIWAIGTGKTATPELAQEMHAYIRQLLETKETPILYGGSLKPDNADTLLAQPDINGGLIGGASLEAASFLHIVHSAQRQC